MPLILFFSEAEDWSTSAGFRTIALLEDLLKNYVICKDISGCCIVCRGSETFFIAFSSYKDTDDRLPMTDSCHTMGKILERLICN